MLIIYPQTGQHSRIWIAARHALTEAGVAPIVRTRARLFNQRRAILWTAKRRNSQIPNFNRGTREKTLATCGRVPTQRPRVMQPDMDGGVPSRRNMLFLNACLLFASTRCRMPGGMRVSARTTPDTSWLRAVAACPSACGSQQERRQYSSSAYPPGHLEAALAARFRSEHIRCLG